MPIKNINDNAPELGGAVSGFVTSMINAPAQADRPYILGSAVIAVRPTGATEPAKVSVGKGAVVKGIMALGVQQTRPRGRLVKSGYADSANNFVQGGVVYGALDLANHDNAVLEATDAVLMTDKNGVFSYVTSAKAKTLTELTAVTSGVSVAGIIHTTAIQPALNETIGANEFNYAEGIGAIALKL